MNELLNIPSMFKKGIKLMSVLTFPCSVSGSKALSPAAALNNYSFFSIQILINLFFHSTFYVIKKETPCAVHKNIKHHSSHMQLKNRINLS